mmetsp:Transcript_41123/g.116415  ORF Transcript_41123/g.116415 Transcript_41123/m.116415 type:complete len:433 (+) Transcript_41123:108-1406(+)
MTSTSALGATLLKCFNQDGDCTVAVPQQERAGRAARPRAEFLVWERLLCAWSDVFAAMFSHDFVEKQERVVEIGGFSAVAVETFLRFLYSGSLAALQSPSVLIEVAALADKYAVQQLQAACCSRFEGELSPATACEMLEMAHQLASATLEARCLEVVFSEPTQALAGGFALDAALLDEVLKSKRLCISDFELATLLLQWGESPVAEAYSMDLGLLLERHVAFAAFTDGQYQKIRSLAAKVDQAAKVQDLWGRCHRGTHTNDLFADLFKMHESQQQIKDPPTKPPFLGYWVNLIPSQPGFGRASTYYVQGKKEDGTENKFAPAGRLEDVARNESTMALDANDEMRWWMPHHGIHVSGASFGRGLAKGLHVQVYASVDGRDWEMLLDSALLPAAPDSAARFPCRSTVCASWLKLCVRKGKYVNLLRLCGIIQRV